jgi:uncharacterized protein YcbX
MHLSALYLYPVKSCAPLAVSDAAVEPRGLAGDRRWMVVDGNGRFVTGREQPRLVLVRAQFDGDAVRLAAPGRPPLRLEPPPADAPRLAVQVWRSQVDAAAATAQADDWISDHLGIPCRFAFMDAEAVRPVDANYGRDGDEVSFADGFPMLLIGEGSLAGLNARLARPVSMQRFRPNLVVGGTEAHVEDGWHRLRIGTVEFERVKSCSRCVFTTVDPDTGARDADGEPLRTLTTYRRMAGGVLFGQNLIPRSAGMLRCGDVVEILE